MPSIGSLTLALVIAASGAMPGAVAPIIVDSPNLGPWQRLLASVGFTITRSQLGPEQMERISKMGGYVLIEGETELAKALGFRQTDKKIVCLSTHEELDPETDVVWEKPEQVNWFQVPDGSIVFTRERWSKAPLVAGYRKNNGGVLWTAVSPGANGYDRFPLLLRALGRLGLIPPFLSRRLWAFFDYSYRSRADPEYLADQWVEGGVKGLHVGGWSFLEPGEGRHQYLRDLIAACHRRGVLVYLWLELPHISESFWDRHPQCREKTALGADANLDWRKLINLANESCFDLAAKEVRQLVAQFDWDGINLAELYFESLQGHANPSRFTPLNDDVRAEFKQRAGFDPLELFRPGSPHYHSSNPDSLRKFLDFRATLAHRIQEQWMYELIALKKERPHLDLVLTHVDDRLDPGIRDAIGSDSRALLPLARRHGFSFLIEDPATVWHLGPERYRILASKYALPKSPHFKLGIDLNIADRYQDVYPTKRPTGAELVLWVSEASRAFPQVALYAEHSLPKQDLIWISSAAAASRAQPSGKDLVVECPSSVAVRWQGAALVNGNPWPLNSGKELWLPAGRHRLTASAHGWAIPVLGFTAELLGARMLQHGFEITYTSSTKAYVVLGRQAVRVLIDGREHPVPQFTHSKGVTLQLPPGKHKVRLYEER